MQREIAKILRFIKGLTWNGFLRLDENNGTPLPYSELPDEVKNNIDKDGNLTGDKLWKRWMGV